MRNEAPRSGVSTVFWQKQMDWPKEKRRETGEEIANAVQIDRGAERVPR